MATHAASTPDKPRRAVEPVTSRRDVYFQRRLLITVGVVVAAGLLLWGAWVARLALLVIYISALLAIGLGPSVAFVQRTIRLGTRRMPRALAIGAVYVALMLVAAVLALVVVPPLLAQASDLQQKLPGMFRAAQQFLVERGLIARPVTLEQAVTGSPPGNTTAVVAVASDAMAGAATGVAAFITTLFLTFYLLLEWPALSARLWDFVPAPRRPAVREMSRLIADRVSAWLGANVVLGGIMGSVTAVGLGLLGVPYFYVLALIAALGETVPVAGSIVAGVIAVGVASTVSVKLAIMVAVFCFVVHEIEANILVPKLMQQRLGVTAAALIVALLIGWEWLGVMGVMLALPTTAVIAAVLEAIGTSDQPATSGIYPKSNGRY
jgi:predicted PurR-regulated permease PerM